MRLIEGTVTSLHRAGRALESLSLRIGAGKCCNTDKYLCRECLHDDKLCHDCKIVWLLELEYSRAFHVFLRTICGLSWVIFGLAALWGNNIGHWWARGKLHERILTIDYLHGWIPENILLPHQYTKYVILSTMACTLVLGVTTTVALSFPRIMAPKAARNKRPQWQTLCLAALYFISYGAVVIREIEFEEWVVIVFPLTMGFQNLSLLMLSLVFRPRLEDRERLEKGDVEGKIS